MIKKYSFEMYNSIDSSIENTCKEIAHICNKEDRCQNPFFIDEDCDATKPPCLYVAREGEKIVGFISTYTLNTDEVELCGFVLPEFRGQGIASMLLDSLFDDYDNYYIQTSIDKNSNSGDLFLKSYEFEYKSTECKMIIEQSSFVNPSDSCNDITVKTVDDKDSISYIALNDNVRIGTCMVNFSGETAVIHDVEISEEYRGKGYGYCLLTNILDNLFKIHKYVILHVTKENTPAYKLYLKLGFRIIEELEYYYI